MSETVHHKGKMILLDVTGTEEEQAEQVLSIIGITRDTFYKTAIKQLENNGYRKWYKYRGFHYKIEDTKLDVNDDIYTAKIAPDDSLIEYELKYHNSGGSFDEVLDEALKKLDRELG